MLAYCRNSGRHHENFNFSHGLISFASWFLAAKSLMCSIVCFSAQQSLWFHSGLAKSSCDHCYVAESWELWQVWVFRDVGMGRTSTFRSCSWTPGWRSRWVHVSNLSSDPISHACVELGGRLYPFHYCQQIIRPLGRGQHLDQLTFHQWFWGSTAA